MTDTIHIPGAVGAPVIKNIEGESVLVFRGRPGATRKTKEKRKAMKPRALKTVAPDKLMWAAINRHSALDGREERYEDGILAGTKTNIKRIQELVRARGFAPHNGRWISLEDFTGGDMSRLEPLVERCELPRTDPAHLDLLIFPNRKRLSRSDEPEYHILMHRLKLAGADILFADEPHYDMYDLKQAPMNAMLNSMGAAELSEQQVYAIQAMEDRAKEQRPVHAIYGYRKVKKSFERTLSDGTTRTVNVGELMPVPEERSIGAEVYERLNDNETPSQVARWLGKKGVSLAGVTFDPETGKRIPCAPADSDQVMRYIRNPLNKGVLQIGETTVVCDFEPTVKPQLWDAVNLRFAHTPAPQHGANGELHVHTGQFRCAGCRSTMTLTNERGEPRWGCHAKKCPARANIAASEIEPYMERLLAQILEADDDLEHEPSKAENERLSELREREFDLIAKRDMVYGDFEEKLERAENYRAQCAAVDKLLAEVQDEITAIEGQRIKTMRAHSAREHYDGMSVAARNGLMRSYWPVVWVRVRQWWKADGSVGVSRGIEDIVWPVPAGEETRWLLPRKGMRYIPEAHESIVWHDGTRIRTSVERRRSYETRVDIPEAARYMIRGASEEEAARWKAAWEYRKEHGRTDDEILDALRTYPTNAAAARELGMYPEEVKRRAYKALLARGEVREKGTLAERAARANYKPELVSNKDVMHAVAIHKHKTGRPNFTRAAKELGMPTMTLKHRYWRLTSDPRADRRNEQKAAQRAAAKARDPEGYAARMRANVARYRERLIEDARGQETA